MTSKRETDRVDDDDGEGIGSGRGGRVGKVAGTIIGND